MFTGASILVVEDNPDLNTAIREILESYGYRVSSAENGLSGLEQLKQVTPDLILSDIMMPGLDGYTLLKHIRADKRLRYVPVIFLSARTSSADQRLAREIGIEDYLTKPVDSRNLIAAINNALRRAKNIYDSNKTAIETNNSELENVQTISDDSGSVKTPAILPEGSNITSAMLIHRFKNTIGFVQLNIRNILENFANTDFIRNELGKILTTLSSEPMLFNENSLVQDIRTETDDITQISVNTVIGKVYTLYEHILKNLYDDVVYNDP